MRHTMDSARCHAFLDVKVVGRAFPVIGEYQAIVVGSIQMEDSKWQRAELTGM